MQRRRAAQTDKAGRCGGSRVATAQWRHDFRHPCLCSSVQRVHHALGWAIRRSSTNFLGVSRPRRAALSCLASSRFCRLAPCGLPSFPPCGSADACALRLLSRGREAHARDGVSMKPRPSGRGFSLRSVRRTRFHMQRAAPSDPKKRAPPHRRDAGVRQTLLRPVVQWRTVPDAGGQVARNDGGSPTGHPPCPEPSTPQSIKPAPMREERSSWVIRNRPCLRWGAYRRSTCAGMPEP